MELSLRAERNSWFITLRKIRPKTGRVSRKYGLMKYYRNLFSAFQKLVDKHVPLKTNIQRGNTAPFMNQQLQRAIYTRSRLKKILNKNPTAENRSNFKKQRNKCVFIRMKAMKNHFKKATKNGTMSNKDFLDLVKPFLSNKGRLANSDNSIVQNDTVITND